MIAVFTPTFNRLEKIKVLFDSLRNQSCKDFVWYIVDDGSIDGTQEYFESLLHSFDEFKIKYYRKPNGGKHTAINYVYEVIEEEWTLLVDSDDYLKEDCISFLIGETQSLDLSIGALSFLRVNTLGAVIGDMNVEGVYSYLKKIKMKIKGDKAGIHRTNYAKGFKFPEFDGEYFMSEMPFFLWFGQRYLTKYINYSGYVCEYLPDGLSSKIIENRYKCINSTLYVYMKMYRSNLGLFSCRAAINWWRFYIGSNVVVKEKPPLIYSPIGFLLNCLDRFR